MKKQIAVTMIIVIIGLHDSGVHIPEKKIPYFNAGLEKEVYVSGAAII